MELFKNITAAASLLLVFASSAAMPVKADDSAQDILSGSRYVTDAVNQCVPAARIEAGANQDTKERAARIFSILGRTPLTSSLVDALKEQDGAICFVDFAEIFSSEDLQSKEAVYDGAYNAAVINTRVSEGCAISAAIHEIQHGAQKNAGLGYPVRDLVREDQKDLVVQTELDAFTIQALGSWLLSRPEYSSQPYEGALACNKGTLATYFPFLKTASEKLDAMEAHGDVAMDSGEAAGDIHRHFVATAGIPARYVLGVNAMYRFSLAAPEFVPYQEIYTLEEMNIALSDLGTIHFEKDYRIAPQP